MPDTVITLTTGNTYLVRETVDEVIAQSVEYLRSLREGDGAVTPALVAQWGRLVT